MKRLLTLFAFFFYAVSASARIYSAIPEPAAARHRWDFGSTCYIKLGRNSIMMRNIIFLLAFLMAVPAFSQVRPDQFFEITNPNNSNFELYSQKAGVPRRAQLVNVKKYMVPFVTDTLAGVPSATGNTTNLGEFVWDQYGALWYIDGEGDAVSFTGGGPIYVTADTTAEIVVYAPSHGLTDTIALYGYVPVQVDFTRANSVDADSVFIAYAIDAPTTDSLTLVFSGVLSYVTWHGKELNVQYYLQDDGSEATTPGTVSMPTAIASDSTTLFLREIGVDIAGRLRRIAMPSALITAFGGNPSSPTDAVVQAAISGVYLPAGLAQPGTVFTLSYLTQSRNPIYQNNAPNTNPITPSYAWLWDGAYATRIVTTITSVDLQDTAYGTLGTLTLLPIDSLMAGAVPADDEVAIWLDTNYTANNLRLPNGSLLYFNGSGTAQNPDYIWQVIDDISFDAADNDWERILKRVSQPASSDGNGLFDASNDGDTVRVSTALLKAALSITGDYDVEIGRLSIDGSTGQLTLSGYANNALNNVDSSLYVLAVDATGDVWSIPVDSLGDSATFERFAISGDTLYAALTGDAVPDLFVVLSSYLDNTDAQTLAFDTATAQLSITGGNTISLDGLFAKGSGSAATIPMWVAWDSLGNSAITQSGQEISMGSLTGSLTLPSGTDAQDPVWAAGMLRYNTTANGIQGYDGTAERYLPWADSDNWASGRIPYSDGNQLSSSSIVTWDAAASEMKIGSSTDRGAFQLQVNGDIYTHSRNIYLGASTNYIRVISSVMNISEDGGRIKLVGNSPVLTFLETNGNTYGNYVLVTRLTSATSSTTLNVCGWDGFGASSGGDVILRGGNGAGTSAVKGGNVLIKGGQSAAGGAADTSGIIILSVFQDNGGSEIQRIKIREEEITMDTVIVLSDYGSGNISGTHAFSASYDANGKLIEVPEKWGAISTSTDGSGDITVAHGMGVTPTSVQVTVTGTTPYVVTVHTIDATNFTVRFYDMTGAAVTSTAVTATWHAKT